MKSFFIYVIFFLYVFGFLSGCESLTKQYLKDPEVNVVDVQVTDINTADISIALTMNVKNPNSVALNLDKITYVLNLGGETVTEGIFSDGIKVPALGEGQVRIPFKFKFKNVGSILTSLMSSNWTKEYELKGTAQLGIFSIPFLKKGEVNFNK